MYKCSQHLLITAPLIEEEPANLYLYTGAVMRDLAVEQYHTVQPEWNRSTLTWPGKETSKWSFTGTSWKVVCQYTDTLCTIQKQTNLTNSLLQGITIFNEHGSTKLEVWLMDTETAADLTSESRTKLAKARSRGLTCTLVMEAINSEKITWD